MSLFFTLVLIAIAWLFSTLIDGIPHLWQLFTLAPLWLLGLLLAGVIAWFVSDP
jgi:hypothetical protein